MALLITGCDTLLSVFSFILFDGNMGRMGGKLVKMGNVKIGNVVGKMGRYGLSMRTSLAV